MKKKSSGKFFLWIIIISFLLAGGIIYYFKFYSREIVISMERAIPQNASLIFEFGNFKQTFSKLKKTAYWTVIQKTDLVSKMEKGVSVLDSFLLHDEMTKQVSGFRMLASLHLTKVGEYDCLLVTELQNMEADMEEILKKTRVNFEEREFQGEKFYDIKVNGNGLATYTVAFSQGLLIASRTPFLVEDALVQMKSKHSILQDEALENIKKLAAKNIDVSVYINFQNLPLLSSVYVEQMNQNSLESLKNFARWSVLDLLFNEKNILLNGYTIAGDSGSAPQFLSPFLHAAPQENELVNIVPDNAAVMFYYSAENILEMLPDVRDVYLQNFFLPWLGHELAYVITEPFDTNFSGQALTVMKAKDVQLGEEKLLALAGETVDTGIEVETYKEIRIRKLNDSVSALRRFGRIFENIRNPFYAFIGQYAVFANSLNELKNVIDKYMSEQTLGKDYNYRQFAENLGSNVNFYCYFNLSRGKQILDAFASPDFAADLKSNFQHYQKFSPVGFQFSVYKNMLYTTGCINFNSSASRQKGLLWQIELDSTVSMKPQMVRNHINKDYEIAVQDDKNNFHLISKGGEVLWKKELEGEILGGIHQVDFFKNGKLQYFFNTRNKVYLIDRNGEEIENFSLRLNSAATAGLTLVDYEKNRNYRFFIPCENGNVYGFEISGKPLPGWNPKSNIGIIRQPVQYFWIDKKDYLVAANESGTVCFFNRKGEVKGKAETKTQFRNPFYFNPAGIKNQQGGLVSADTSGKVFEIAFDGKFKIHEIFKTSSGYSPFFILEDIAGDSLKEYCFIRSDKLEVWSNDSSLLFTYQFPEKIIQPAFTVKQANNLFYRLGAVCDSTQQLFLFGREGKPEEGFPISGSTPFEVLDLYADSGQIVVGAKKESGVFTYRLK